MGEISRDELKAKLDRGDRFKLVMTHSDWGYRANAEGRSTKRARVMIVVGTLGIAGFAGILFWTIIGPIIAVAIVTYWVRKIRDWRGDTPRAA